MKTTPATIIAWLITLSSFLSCKKESWYDVKPIKSLAVPSTLKDMQAIMNFEELNGFSVGLGEVGSDGHYVNATNYDTRLPAIEKNAYTWTHTVPYENLYDWGRFNLHGSYPRVFYCNLVLEGLTKIAPSNEIEQFEWNSIKGQALFQRARTFYELSQVFAPPYNDGTSTTDLGIPLRLETDINIPSKRASVKETYEQIIKDLLIAKDLVPANILPVNSLYKMRPTKTAVLGLLARVYLSMEDYINAGIYANDCLNNYSVLLDYSQLSTTGTPIEIYNSEIIFHSTMYAGYRSLRFPFIEIEQSLYNLYDSNDLRKEIFYKKNGSVNTLNGQYSGSNTTLFSGLATDELYLIRAECKAREGKYNEAMQDLNTLLKMRWKKDINGLSLYTDQIALNADDALVKIIVERKKELVLRGLRWSDLRRLNMDDRFKISITRSTPLGHFTLEPNSFKYTFPIPDDIIAITGMPQNLGW